jgi:hypothetical protein
MVAELGELWMKDRVRHAAGADVGGDVDGADRSDMQLMIYSAVTGSAATTIGVLTARVLGAFGYLISVVLIAAAVRFAHPVLKVIRRLLDPA